jgi:16S rRNA (uracil1498-N3)-methyltransferase
MARRWRVYHAELPAEPGESFELTEEESHHVRRVLRLQPGERIAVFDGGEREWEATLEPAGGRRVRVRLETPVETVVESPLEVVICQGLCRPERMDWLVQKATEAGVAAVLPFATEADSSHRVTENRLGRWRRVAVEACKQSGRRRIPRIEPLASLPPLPDGALGLLLDTRPGISSLAEVCAGVESVPRQVWLAVGPESGFGERDGDALRASGWRPVGLGPRILRSETAGLLAASILLHLWGDLGNAPCDSL